VELDTIVCGDCLDVMAEMPDGCVDLVVTSPPYDNIRDYDDYIFDFNGVAQGLYKVTKQGGVVVWIVADQTINGSETGTSFRQSLGFIAQGFNLHDTMIYKKKNPLPLQHNRYAPCFEFMFVLSKGKPETFNPILVETLGRVDGCGKRLPNGEIVSFNSPRGNQQKYRTNIWSYGVGGETWGNHPAVFPEQLANDHIVSWSNPNDLVFDPFIGSGTTAVAALKLGRHFYGCDISPEYVNLANERIEKTRLEMSQMELNL